MGLLKLNADTTGRIEQMTEKKYILTEESKDVNDALNRLSMVLYMLYDEKPKLSSQMEQDLIIIQRFANKYGYIKQKEEL